VVGTTAPLRVIANKKRKRGGGTGGEEKKKKARAKKSKKASPSSSSPLPSASEITFSLSEQGREGARVVVSPGSA
jgi:hypothetical protein